MKKHIRRALALAVCLMMVIGTMAPYAFADNETSADKVYQVGDTFEADSRNAQLPENIAKNTEWSGPSWTNKLICEKENELVFKYNEKGRWKTYTGDLYIKTGDGPEDFQQAESFVEGNTYYGRINAGAYDRPSGDRFDKPVSQYRYVQLNVSKHVHNNNCYGVTYVWTLVAKERPSEKGDWTYAYYLGQEYFGNTLDNAGLYPDPLEYGIQGEIKSITVTDDNGKSWTFNWNTTANGEWRIEGRNVSKETAENIPVFTDGGRYTGTCGNDTYKFTLTKETKWNYSDSKAKHVNVFYYIRFIADYTVNVYHECSADTDGAELVDGKYYIKSETKPGEFTFYYPNNGAIDDSECEDPLYTEPTTLRAQNYVSNMLPGYELNKATDSAGTDVTENGITVGLFKDNVLNVYCTLKEYTVEYVWAAGTAKDVTDARNVPVDNEKYTVINPPVASSAPYENVVVDGGHYEFIGWTGPERDDTKLKYAFTGTWKFVADVTPPEVKGSFIVQKVDKDGNVIGYADITKNAEFELYKADANGNIENDGLKDIVVAWNTVDKDGRVTFDNLSVGNYILKESKAPEGYKLSNDEWLITVAAGEGDAAVVTVENSNGIITSLGDSVYNFVNEPEEVIPPVNDSGIVIEKEFKGLPESAIAKAINNISFELYKENAVSPLFGRITLEKATKDGNVYVIKAMADGEAFYRIKEFGANIEVSDDSGNRYKLISTEYKTEEPAINALTTDSKIEEQSKLFHYNGEKDATVRVINTYEKINDYIPPVDPTPTTGTLTVTKTVTGFETLPEGYNVTITVKQGDTVIRTATLNSFTDGKATYSFYGLPAGTYTVSETAADVDGYKLEATADQTVTVTAGGTVTAAFVNAYTKVDEPVTPDDPENPDVPDKPDKPEKPETPKDNAVKTGDTTNTGIAWGVFGAALLGLGGFAVRRRKASK